MKLKSNHVAMLLSSAMALNYALGSTQAMAAAPKKGGGKEVTLMQLQDVHGHMLPHNSILKNDVKDANAGGVAKLATLIKQVRLEDPDSLLLMIGDTTHGSAEMLFTMGDAIMPVLNELDIDVFTPGNWDFGWGPRVYRQRFTAANPPLAPNNRTSIAWMDGKPGHEGQTCNLASYNWQPPGANAPFNSPFVPASLCHVTKANFPTVATNLYNYDEVAGTMGDRVHKPYLIKEVNGNKIAIIGLTTDVVPQQAQAFNTGFRFTMGYDELPQDIAAAKAEGAELIVVLSELGFGKNIQLVKEFPEINVMFSGHTHERTPEPVIIDRGDENGPNYGIVTEAGEDDFLGRLNVKFSDGKVVDWSWDLMEASSSVPEDPAIKAIVEQELETFYSWGKPQCHTFGVNAFPFGKGHTLCDPLDTVVGFTDPTIERFDVLEEISNNYMTDAFLDLAESLGESDSKDNPLSDDNTLSTTNGFRYDLTVLGRDDGYSGEITVGDLYAYYPIGAALALAEFTGGRLIDHWNGILNHVFDPNPYRQRGGWFLGYTHNMHFDIELNDKYPLTISYGSRIDSVTINGKKVDRSKIYTLASCYPHGNPVDEVCRTSGATNVRFLTYPSEALNVAGKCGADEVPAAQFSNGNSNCQLDMTASPTVKTAVNSENIFDPQRFGNGVPVPFGGTQKGPLFLQVAPVNFVHPVDALRRYIPGNDVTTAAYGLGRVTAVTGVPVSEEGGAGIVQPSQGAGPTWMKREFVKQSNQNQQ